MARVAARGFVGSAKRRRRTQVERTARARARLIDAATACLDRFGYSGATTAVIVKAAGLSSGAMQHHFQSKALLMAAVAEHLADVMWQSYRTAVRGIDDPAERLRAVHDTAWNLVVEPHFAVLLELMLASRADPELAAAVRPIYARNDERIRRWVRLLSRTGRVSSPARIDVIRRAINTVLLGFAAEWSMGRDRANLEEARLLLRAHLNALLERVQ